MLPLVIYDPTVAQRSGRSDPQRRSASRPRPSFSLPPRGESWGTASAWCAMALFVLNPNALYVQSIPMMEAVFFLGLMGILFFTTRYHETQSIADLVGAALMCLAASLTRYEGWIFIPFVTLYILFVTRRARIPKTLLFGVLASLGVVWWLFYNWWLSGNMLYFYNGRRFPARDSGRPALSLVTATGAWRCNTISPRPNWWLAGLYCGSAQSDASRRCGGGPSGRSCSSPCGPRSSSGACTLLPSRFTSRRYGRLVGTTHATRSRCCRCWPSAPAPYCSDRGRLLPLWSF